MPYVVIAFFALLSLYLLWRLRVIKKQMREMKETLQKNRDLSYNKQIAVTLADPDLAGLASEFNKSLDYQKMLKREAEKSEIRLKQSVSDIAHDLRTPVTVVKGNLQRIAMQENLSEESREYLGICEEKTDALRSMIDDFFELSFYESELTKVELSKLDLTNFTVQFLVDHEALIREHGLTPDIRLPEKSIFISAEEQLLLRMFGNLLGNIFRHTKKTFSLWVEENEEDVKIVFANPLESGQVLSVEHIFDRTYRGDKARTGGGPGGLGLYIVKLLAEKQNAHVEAQLKENKLFMNIYFHKFSE